MKFDINGIWPSSLGYTETDTDAVFQVVNYVLNNVTRDNRAAALEASNLLRRALGLEEVNPEWLQAGSVIHNAIDKDLSNPTGGGNYTAHNLMQYALEDIVGDPSEAKKILDRQVSGSTEYERESSLRKLAQEHIIPESIAKKHSQGYFRPDAIVLLKVNGKRYIVIDDFKGPHAARYTKNYQAQLDEYRQRWFDLPEGQRQSILAGTKYKDWYKYGPDDIEVRGVIVNSKTVREKQSQPTERSTWTLTGEYARETKARLARAASVLPGSAIASIVEHAIAGELTSDDVKALQAAALAAPTAKSSQPTFSVPEIKIRKPVQLSRKTKAVKPVPITVRVGVGDKFSATVGGEEKEFETLNALLSTINSGVSISRVSIQHDVAGDPSQALRLITATQAQGTSISHTGFSPELTYIAGKPQSALRIGGETVKTGDEIPGGYTVMGFREYSPGYSVMVVAQGGQDYNIPIKLTPHGPVIGGYAATPIVDKPERGVDPTLAAETPRSVGVFEAMERALAARIKGKNSGLTRPDTSPGAPPVRTWTDANSIQLRGVNIQDLKPGRLMYRPANDTNTEGGDKESRIVAFPVDEYLSRVPGMTKAASGRYFIGRPSYKAVKFAKDAWKALRSQGPLAVTAGRQDRITSAIGVTKGASSSSRPNRGNNYRLAVLNTGAISQGMGYIILPKGVKQVMAETQLNKRFDVPDGFTWDDKFLSGDTIRTADGRIRIGFRKEWDQKKGESVQVPVHLAVGNSYSEVGLNVDSKEFRASEGFKGEGASISLPLVARTSNFTSKHMGIKAYMRTLTYEMAEELFGESDAEALSEDGKRLTMVLGSDDIKSLPSFATAVADAIGDNTFNDFLTSDYSEEEMIEATRQLFERAQTGEGEISLTTGAQAASYALKMGDQDKVSFVTMDALFPVTAEFTHGNTQLNSEEAMLYKVSNPEMYEGIQRKARRAQLTNASIIRANKIMEGSPVKEDEHILTLPAQTVNEVMDEIREKKGPNFRSSDLFRKLLGKYEGLDTVAPIHLEGTDVYLPSLSAIAQMSTIDPATGEELERTSREMFGLLTSTTSKGEYQIDRVDKYRARLKELANTEAIHVGVQNKQLRNALYVGYQYHMNMPEGGVFIPPRDLIEMVPGLRGQLARAENVAEQQNILSDLYSQLDGEAVTFFRRPETDPLYSVLPMRMVNPFEVEGLSDIALELMNAPMTQQLHTMASDSIYEPASADVDFDTALLQFTRNVSLDKETGDLRKAHIGGKAMTARQVEKHSLARLLEMGALPQGVDTIKQAHRYVTLFRAGIRGATFGVDPSDDKAMLHLISDDERFAGALARMASENPAPGSQMSAIYSDMNDLIESEQGTPMERFLKSLKLVKRNGDGEYVNNDPDELFATTAQISQGSIDYVKAKRNMGPTYTFLRVLNGAFLNAVDEGRLKGKEMLEAYEDIAKASNLYQRSLDLKGLTKREEDAISRLYRTARTFFNPFEGKSVRAMGPQDNIISMQLGGFKSGFIRDIIGGMTSGDDAGHYVRSMIKAIKAPIAEGKINQRFPYSPEELAMSIGTEHLSDNPVVKTIKDLIERVVPRTVLDAIADRAMNETGGVWKDEVVNATPQYYNRNLPGEMLDARISTGEAKLLRNLEKLPADEVARIASASAAPSFDPGRRRNVLLNERAEERKNIPVDAAAGFKASNFTVPTPDETQAVTATPAPENIPQPEAQINAQQNDIGEQLGGIMAQIFEMARRYTLPVVDYNSVGPRFLKGLSAMASGQFDPGLARRTKSVVAGQFDAAVDLVSNVKPPSIHTVNASNTLANILAATGRNPYMDAGMTRKIAYSQFGEGGAMAQSYQWQIRRAQEMMAIGEPTSQQGKQDWFRMTERLETSSKAILATAETMREAGFEDLAKSIESFAEPMAKLLPSFQKTSEAILSGEYTAGAEAVKEIPEDISNMALSLASTLEERDKIRSKDITALKKYIGVIGQERFDAIQERYDKQELNAAITGPESKPTNYTPLTTTQKKQMSPLYLSIDDMQKALDAPPPPAPEQQKRAAALVAALRQRKKITSTDMAVLKEQGDAVSLADLEEIQALYKQQRLDAAITGKEKKQAPISQQDAARAQGLLSTLQSRDVLSRKDLSALKIVESALDPKAVAEIKARYEQQVIDAAQNRVDVSPERKEAANVMMQSLRERSDSLNYNEITAAKAGAKGMPELEKEVAKFEEQWRIRRIQSVGSDAKSSAAPAPKVSEERLAAAQETLDVLLKNADSLTLGDLQKVGPGFTGIPGMAEQIGALKENIRKRYLEAATKKFTAPDTEAVATEVETATAETTQPSGVIRGRISKTKTTSGGARGVQVEVNPETLAMATALSDKLLNGEVSKDDMTLARKFSNVLSPDVMSSLETRFAQQSAQRRIDGPQTQTDEQFVALLKKATPVMRGWVENLEKMSKSLENNKRKLTKEEVAEVQRGREVFRKYKEIAGQAGEMSDEERQLVERGDVASLGIGMFGDKPERGGIKGFFERLKNPRTGLGSDLFFTSRMFRQFLQPLIGGGEQYQQYQNQMNAYRMMGGAGIDRGSQNVVENLQQMKMSRMRTGGYIMAGANGMLGGDGLGSQTVSDVLGIGGAAIGTGLVAANLASMLPMIAGSAGPIGLAATTLTGLTLGGLRVAGEAKDTDKMKAEVAAGNASPANRLFVAREYAKQGNYTSAYNDAALPYWTDIKKDFESTGNVNGATRSYMFGSRGGKEFESLRVGISGGATGEMRDERLQIAGSLWGNVATTGMRRAVPGNEFQSRGAEIGTMLGNVLDTRLVGLSPEATYQMSLSWVQAMGEGKTTEAAQLDFLKQAFTGSAYENMSIKGMLPQAMSGFLQYAGAKQGMGQVVTKSIEDFSQENQSVTERAGLAQYYSTANALGSLGLTYNDSFVAQAGQLPLQSQRDSLVRSEAQMFNTLPLLTKEVQSLVTGMEVAVPGRVDPLYGMQTLPVDEEFVQKQNDAMRMLTQVQSGNPWAASKMKSESLWDALPDVLQSWFGGGESMPAIFQKQTTRGFQIGYENLPSSDTELGQAMRYGFKVDGEQYQGIESYIGQGGTFEAAMHNAFVGFAQDAIPIQVAHKGLDAIEKFGSGDGMMPAFGAVEGKGLQQLQIESAAEGYRDSMFKLSLQFEDLADNLKFVPEKLDIQDQLFNIGVQKQREQMQDSWSRFEIQWQWGMDDLLKNFNRSMTRIGWSESDLNFRQNTSQLDFAWAMEDIQENLKYATGRQRRALLRQQDRGTIKFALGQSQIDEQRSRLDIQRQWAEEDFNTAQDRHNKRMEWESTRFARQNAYFEQETALRMRLNAINRAMTMNQLNRQQRSLQNAQQHLRLTYAQQRAIQAIQMTVQNFQAGVSKITNEGARSVEIFGSLSASLRSAAAGARRLRSALGGGVSTGRIKYYANGGYTGEGGTAVLHPGEYVLNSNLTKTFEQRVGPLTNSNLNALANSGDPRVISVLQQILGAIVSQDVRSVNVSVNTNDARAGAVEGLSIAKELELS